MTTIASEPEADVEELGDHELLSAYLGGEEAVSARSQDCVRPFDWPPEQTRMEVVSLDPAAVRWFQMRYADWRAEISLVLRAWIKAHAEQAMELLRAG